MYNGCVDQADAGKQQKLIMPPAVLQQASAVAVEVKYTNRFMSIDF